MMVARGELINAIKKYLILIAEDHSEEADSRELRKIIAFVPNSQISALIYNYEKERTPEEIADEAMLREQIFVQGGKAALDDHIRKNYYAIFENPDTDYTCLFCAVQILEGIEGHPLPELREIVTKKHHELFPPKG